MSYFVVWILWPEFRIYWQGVGFFDGDKPQSKNLDPLKISVKNFFRFIYFAGFDFKLVLLGQNSFNLIAFF